MALVRPSARNMQIDSASLYQRIETIHKVGSTRLAYTAEDIQGRSVTVEMMRQVGLEVSIDAAGNIVGRRAGRKTLPPVVFGSHVDTVRNGGRYDGILGVMAAIESVAVLQEANHETQHPLELIVFANEEGQRFGALCGSRAVVGALGPEDLEVADETGFTLAQAIDAVGGDARRLSSALRNPGEMAAYVELHIEQGGSLEKARVPIGVVEGISGISHTDVHIKGRAAHSGTTSMEIRRDALVAAAELVLCVQNAARDKRCQVATVGRLNVQPNSVNIVPGEVSLTFEVRDLEREKISSTVAHLRECGEAIALRSSVQMEFSERRTIEPVPCSTTVQEAIMSACADLGLKYLKMPSGAGHDAQMMAKLGPIGMIFVPSKDGVSHSPGEFTSSDDCAHGAQVLLETILRLDETLAGSSESGA
jgi:N-carbamoyl-L-amino-acid hydrolase